MYDRIDISPLPRCLALDVKCVCSPSQKTRDDPVEAVQAQNVAMEHTWVEIMGMFLFLGVVQRHHAFPGGAVVESRGVLLQTQRNLHALEFGRRSVVFCTRECGLRSCFVAGARLRMSPRRKLFGAYFPV